MSSSRRIVVCAALGVVAGAAATVAGSWQLAVLVGWVGFSLALLLWIWTDVHALDAAATRARSTREDSSRAVTVLVVATASVVSLVGVAFGLAESRHVELAMEVVLTALSAISVATAWCLVHTVFALHYAHLYYSEPVGGIDIPGDDAPDYRDFAYFSFTIGMSFATSDSDITGRRVRRTALRHAMLSYFFGAVIVGYVINVIAGLI